MYFLKQVLEKFALKVRIVGVSFIERRMKMLFSKINKKYLLGIGLAVLVGGGLLIGSVFSAKSPTEQVTQAVVEQETKKQLTQDGSSDNQIQGNGETGVKEVTPQAKTKNVKEKSKYQNEDNNKKINQIKEPINKEKYASENLKEDTKQKPKQQNVQVEKTTEKTENQSESVYITKNGKCYHKGGCKHLKKSKIKMDKEEAEKYYSPCKNCKPE